MKNFKEICRLLMLIALFSCFGIIENVNAVVVDQTCPPGYVYTSGTCVRMNRDGSYNYKDTVKPTSRIGLSIMIRIFKRLQTVAPTGRHSMKIPENAEPLKLLARKLNSPPA